MAKAKKAKKSKKGFLYRRAQMKGLLGGSKGWTILWAVLFGKRVLKRLAGNEPEVVYSEELRPGEALVIRHGERADRVR